MAPWLMLLAQVYGKHQQQQQARKKMVEELEAQRVARLGGDTMGLRAAQFNRALSQQNYASPQELMQMYGAVRGSDEGDVPAGSQSPYADITPEQKEAIVRAERAQRQGELLDPWQDYSRYRDPYQDSFMPRYR